MSPQVGVSVVILALGGAQSAVKAPGRANMEVSDQDDNHLTAPISEARSRLWLPLVRRVRQPFLGAWALPGGDLTADESLEQCAYEALASTTDLHPRYLEQLHTFGGPDRSSGGLPMVSIAYWALVGRAEAGDFADGENVRWFPEDMLDNLDLAFDHRQIIAYALDCLRTKIEYPEIVARLVGPSFTLRQLHSVYEGIAGEAIDLANFRRKILASGQLEDTGEKMREGRQRPAAVYRYMQRTDSASWPHVWSQDCLQRLEAARAQNLGAAADSSDARDETFSDEALDALMPGR